MNSILEKIIKDRNGHYCHCVEVAYADDLESISDAIINEFQEYGEDEIIDFLSSMDVYYIGDDKEEEERVYNFSFDDYIRGTI